MQKYLATHSQPDYFYRVNIMIHERSKKIPQGANFLSHHWSNHVAPSPAEIVLGNGMPHLGTLSTPYICQGLHIY